MAYRSSTVNAANTNTPNTAVPAGIAANDIAILIAEVDSTSAVFQSADFTSAGFTLLDTASLAADGQRTAIGWRRCTGSETGSWTIGDVGVTGDTLCQAILFSGRHTTNPPVASTATIVDPAAADTVNFSIGGITALLDDDILMALLADIGLATPAFNMTVVPTNYTGRTNQTAPWCGGAMATRDAVAAGATGALTGTYTTSSSTNAYAGWTIRIPAAAGGSDTPIAIGQGTPTLLGRVPGLGFGILLPDQL